MHPENGTRSIHSLNSRAAMPGRSRLSSCELFGIDAFAEDDLGYAPS
jgi:hypothetical protein